MKENPIIYYGGDYNPEQWDEQTMEEDMRLFEEAGITIVTLNVFSWALLQPSEDTYDFTTLDRIVDTVTKHSLSICMATSTAAHPAWMARKYPDILRTEFNGMKRKYGSRHNSCPNSPNFRRLSRNLAGALAEHYKDQKNIVAWHISNEYGGACYCENCERAFRGWLKQKYKTLDALNKAWGTNFWSHTFYDWDEIVAPNLLSEHIDETTTDFQGISLDYARFNSDSILQNCVDERDAIREVLPDAAVTTNMMYYFKDLDYQKWAKELDFASWDSYPRYYTKPASVALWHDVMRSLRHGQPFWLMEQTPSVTNWQPVNRIRRPGEMRLWSYQAVAHGADSVMFFQMRRSAAASEKYHGAVIDHVGTNQTRVFREVKALGGELKKLGNQTTGARTPAKVAILFDWNNWWAVEYSSGPNDRLRYTEEVHRYYEALFEQNVSVDLVDVYADLSAYQLVIAPTLYMVKPGVDEALKTFVKNGGELIVSFFSGIVDENDHVTLGGYPGKLRDLLGIWVEEIDAVPEESPNAFTYQGETYPATLLCDLLHAETAEVHATYRDDFYSGMPAITCNHYGKGKAWYVATASDHSFYQQFLKDRIEECSIAPVLNTPKGVEAALRESEKGTFLFLLNHNKTEETVLLPDGGVDLLTDCSYAPQSSLTLPAKGVAILKK